MADTDVEPDRGFDGIVEDSAGGIVQHDEDGVPAGPLSETSSNQPPSLEQNRWTLWFNDSAHEAQFEASLANIVAPSTRLWMYGLFAGARLLSRFAAPESPGDPPKDSPFLAVSDVAAVLIFFIELGVQILSKLKIVQEGTVYYNRIRSTCLAFHVVIAHTVLLVSRLAVVSSVESCEGAPLVYDNTSKEEGHFHCVRWAALADVSIPMFIAIAVRFRLLFLVIYLIGNITSLIIILETVPTISTEATKVISIVEVCVMGIGMIAMRRSMEKYERHLFVTSARLTETAALLAGQREALRTQLKTFVPDALLRRSEYTLMNSDADVSTEATILVANVVDFLTRTTEIRPLQVASALEQMHKRVALEVSGRGLFVASIVSDHICAVGNLVEKRDVDHSLYRASQAAVAIIAKAPRRALQLRVLVHKGVVVGAFCGTHRVAYDVGGAGVAQANVGLSNVPRLTAAVSADAISHVQSDLVVDLLNDLVDGESDMKCYAILQIEPNFVYDEMESQLAPMRSRGEEEDSFSRVEPTGERYTSGSPSRHSSQLQLRPPSVNVNVETNATLLRSAASFATANAPIISKENNSYPRKSSWVFFLRFENPQVERTYVVNRIAVVADKAPMAMTAFAAAVGLLAVMAAVDAGEARGMRGVGVLIVLALLSVLIGFIPRWLGTRFLSLHVAWTSAIVLLAAAVVWGVALSRPSTIGHSPAMSLFMLFGMVVLFATPVSAFVLIFIPTLSLLMSIHFLFPGSRARVNEVIVAIAIPAFLVLIGRDMDNVLRGWFIDRYELQRIAALLREERRVRVGLLTSALPSTVSRALDHFVELPPGDPEDFTTLQVHTVANTAVMLVRWEGHFANFPKRFDALDSVLESTAHSLEVVSTFGDCVLVATPVVVTPGDAAMLEGEDPGALAKELVECGLALVALGSYSVLCDIDTSTQVVRLDEYPSYNLRGPVVTRLMGIASLVEPEMIRGMLVTDRVLQLTDGATDPHPLHGLPIRKEVLPPWRLRGLGMFRMTRLSDERTPKLVTEAVKHVSPRNQQSSLGALTNSSSRYGSRTSNSAPGSRTSVDMERNLLGSDSGVRDLIMSGSQNAASVTGGELQ